MIKPYNFREVEESVLKFWEKNDIHGRLKKKNSKGKKFYFLQGPPYTSGRLHIAHAWNNSLKDIAMRYKRTQGFDVWDRAGYDMHGLPTENKVQKELKLKHKDDIIKYGLGKFVKACKKFSVDNAKLMDKDLWRLGVWMDYENAYHPIDNNFIEGEWWFIKKAWDQKRFYKGHKIMHWCASCETSLAKHELEYENDTDTSVFLKFRLKEKENEFLIIWTTTPWTIPYNLGVMVNPSLDYSKVKVDNEIWYVAKALVGAFLSSVCNKKFEVLEEFTGDKMEGWEYEHPLYNDLKKQYDAIRKDAPKLHTVWLSKEFVDTTAGTGLVHSAPGCGPEDFEVGKKYGLPAFNNLNEQGAFEDMGKFNGWTAKVDDKKFIEEFRKNGTLIETAEVEHEYAHCWRCKQPVVFRPTLQWFLKIEDLVDNMIKANQKVNWTPKFGSKSFDAWVSALKDNSVTRQRFWGCPAPIWECECGEVIVVGSSKELKKLCKSVPDDLHRPYVDDCKIKCHKCGKEISRIPDVIDVWIDSGTASWNCLEYPIREDYFKKYFPADFILEATEQVRLWFSMLSICSMIAFKKNCYGSVYMHGMILDYQGLKMSKSLGNIISPYEVIDKYGADILRYYMCSVTAGENINFSWDDVRIKQRNLLVYWNIHKFIIDMANNLGKNPEEIKESAVRPDLGLEEKYIISKLNSTVKEVTKLFEEYRLDETISRIENLLLELSRTYIQMIRDKAALGTDKQKEAVLYTVYTAFLRAMKMFAIIVPFAPEQMYLNFKEEFGIKEDSIHMFSFPEFDEKKIDKKLEKQMGIASTVIQSVLSLREKAQLGIRWPMKEAFVVTANNEHTEAIENMAELIKKQANVKEVSVKKALKGTKVSIKIDYKKAGPVFGQNLPQVITHLAQESAEKVLGHISEHGYYEIKINNQKISVLKEHLIVERDIPKNLLEAESAAGLVYIDTDRNDELEAEGFAREVMRRVQSLRKESGLEKKDSISLFIKTDEDLAEMLESWQTQIKEKVGASVLKISVNSPAKKHKHTSKEKVKGAQFELFFDKV